MRKGVDKLSPKRPIWGLGGRERHLKSQVIFDMTSTDAAALVFGISPIALAFAVAPADIGLLAIATYVGAAGGGATAMGAVIRATVAMRQTKAAHDNV